MDHVQRGRAAAQARQYDEAIKHYDAAIAYNPNAVDYYIARSEAHHRKQPPNRELALSDADTAVVLATKRQKRENIMDAQQRRFVSLFGLERYADAKHVFDIVRKMQDKDMQGGGDKAKKREGVLGTWGMKIVKKLDEAKKKLENEANGLTEEEKTKLQIMTTVTVPDVPDAKSVSSPATTSSQTPVTPALSSTASSAPGLSEQVKKVKFRDGKLSQDHWFERSDTVSISLPLKGLPKDQTSVEITAESLGISFPTGPGTEHSFDFSPLYAKIDPEKSSFKITPNKVEVTLHKVQAKKWPVLESDQLSGTSETGKSESTIAHDSKPKTSTTASGPPAYPTSSRNGPKNWDKVVKEASRKQPVEGDKGSKKDDKDAEEYEDLDNDTDDVNYFFKKLYAGADANTRRAMMKSYQESNGTALSTNWEEVSKGEVETSPPDGMEAKKWGQ